jgi:hypothetical protein
MGRGVQRPRDLKNRFDCWTTAEKYENKNPVEEDKREEETKLKGRSQSLEGEKATASHFTLHAVLLRAVVCGRAKGIRL